jgi:hypothetical protein
MNGSVSPLGIFLYAVIAFIMFSGIPLVKYFIRKHNASKEANNAKK